MKSEKREAIKYTELRLIIPGKGDLKTWSSQEVDFHEALSTHLLDTNSTASPGTPFRDCQSVMNFPFRKVTH